MTLDILNTQPKQYFALLNGISKCVIDKDESMTAEFLHTNIFSDSEITIEQVTNAIEVFSNVFKHGILENYTTEQLLTYLKDNGLENEDFIAAWSKIWNNVSGKAHQDIIKQSTWNNTLSNVSWRIDMLSSKSSTEVDAIALMKLQTKTADDTPSSILLELDRQDLQSLLTKMNDIQGAIDKCMNTAQ